MMKFFTSLALSALALGMNLLGADATHVAFKVSGAAVGTPPAIPAEASVETALTATGGEVNPNRRLQAKTYTITYCRDGAAFLSSEYMCFLFSFEFFETLDPADGTSDPVQTQQVDCTPEQEAQAALDGKPPPYTCYAVIYKWLVTVTGQNTEDPNQISFVFDDDFTKAMKDYIQENTPVDFDVGNVEAVIITDSIVEGDPHFKTWGGKWFDFMGECDMKLVHAPVFDGEDKPLDIDVRTKIRYDYSYVQSAAIKLGNDTLEVASFGDYFLNDVEGASMPAFLGGYPVTHSNPSKKVHIFEIEFEKDEKIVIKTFKDLVAVSLDDANLKRMKGALGMSGSFDKLGMMVGRDGKTVIEDPNAFANEWQIRQDETSLFHVAKGPQHPEQCKLPKISTSDKRRRLGEGLAREKAERACAHFQGEHFENCVFDVMAIGDIEIAQAGAY